MTLQFYHISCPPVNGRSTRFVPVPSTRYHLADLPGLPPQRQSPSFPTGTKGLPQYITPRRGYTFNHSRRIPSTTACVRLPTPNFPSRFST